LAELEDHMKNTDMRTLVRNFLIELVIYGVLIVIYFVLVLRWLAEPLERLFGSNLALYAVVALVLIVAQGVLLEWVTSVIIGQLGLDRLE
jgi:hypothetical protein